MNRVLGLVARDEELSPEMEHGAMTWETRLKRSCRPNDCDVCGRAGTDSTDWGYRIAYHPAVDPSKVNALASNDRVLFTRHANKVRWFLEQVCPGCSAECHQRFYSRSTVTENDGAA